MAIVQSDIVLADGAVLNIESGETVNNATVNSGGTMYVSSGGTANNIIENGGYVNVSSGAVVSFVPNTIYSLQLNSTSATVHSNTTAINAIIHSAGRLNISSGGFAENTIVYSGNLFIDNGGKAQYITMSGGIVRVVGTIENTTMFGGVLHIANGGCVSGVTFYAGGINVSSGATMVNTQIERALRMTVSSGGTINNTVVGQGGGSVTIYGTANNIAIYSKGVIFLRDGGTVNNAIINSGGGFDVAGIANNVTVTCGGIIVVSSGGRLTGRLDFEKGAVVSALKGAVFDLDLALATAGRSALLNMSVVQGTPLYNLSVKAEPETGIYLLAEGAADFDGSINVLNEKETEPQLIAVGETVFVSGVSCTLFLAGGDLSLAVGCETPTFVVSSGNVLTSETASVESGTIYCKTVVSKGGTLIVSSGGTAYRTVLNRGELHISDGGLAKFANCSSSGCSIFVSNGGIANNTVIENGGRLYVSSGGLAEKTVQKGGSMYVGSGGTANSATIYSNGWLFVSNGGRADNVMVNYSGGRLLISSGGTANNAYVNMLGSMSVYSGGTANRTTVISQGHLSVQGTANSTSVINYGRMTVFSGGKANDTTIDGGSVEVSSGGEVVNAIVNISGLLYVRSGGSAVAIKENGGTVDFSNDANVTIVSNTISGLMLNTRATVHSGTTAVNITLVDSGSLAIHSGGIAVGTTVNSNSFGGGLEVRSGGTANSTTINQNSLHILSCGTANYTTINNGVLSIDRLGLANSITINSGGHLFVSSGGTATGKMMFDSGAMISMYEGAILDFDLTQAEAGEVALVNDLSIIQGTPIYTLTVDADSLKPGSYVYSLAEGAENFARSISVVNTAGYELSVLTVGETVRIGYDDYTLNLNEGVLTLTVESPDLTPQTPTSTVEQVSWEKTEAEEYIVEYSTDNFEHVIRVVTAGNAVDMPDLPGGTYQWRVKADGNSDWAVGEAIVSETDSDVPKLVQAIKDAIDDIFFASPNGAWSRIYYAQHVGSVDEDWSGTKEIVSASGKGRIQNLFFGSSDPNVLCLTDGENGDAIFVDDVYTELPEEIEANTARLLRIQEIRAGAGDDIVDMTSQQFEYIGDGLTIRGGEGNDTIWANKGDNRLFGDAGNDRIVGASGNDVIVGGIGNDRMHGGGGSDVFTFCDNWGIDSVEQLAGGSATLWFAEGSKDNWDEATQTYTDGDNSVKVSGVTADKVTLKFGDDGSDAFATLSGMGAFFDATTERIFEESGKGILASL